MFRYFKGIVPAAFVVAGLAAGIPSYAAQVGLSKVAPAAQVGLSSVAKSGAQKQVQCQPEINLLDYTC